jgi:hypothetical protein
MTSERRIMVSVADIKLISYECKKCKARVSFSPDSILEAASQCFQCRAPWTNAVIGENEQIGAVHYAALSPARKLMTAIAGMRNPDVANSLGFRVLFEYEEPVMPSASQT